jgi:hypothetical protein
LKIRNEVIREKMRIRETVLGRMKNNAPNWYGHAVASDVLTRWPEEKDKWKTRKEMGKGSEKREQAEGSNT